MFLTISHVSVSAYLTFQRTNDIYLTPISRVDNPLHADNQK